MKKLQYLPQEILKVIACITMLIDHVGLTVFPDLLWLRVIGRLAFPIYCFLLTEGMRHTRHPGKYLLRLGIGVLLAELPFDYLIFDGFTLEHQSVMVTLTLGGIMLLTMDKTPSIPIKALLAIPFAITADTLQCDYGAYGILLIAIFALTDNRLLQAALVLVINLIKDAQYVIDALQYFPSWPTGAAVKRIFSLRPPVQSFSLAAMIPIGLYSGKKLTRSKAVQMGFYLFYPVHLALLFIFVNYLL